MTTFDNVPSFSQYAVMRLANLARKRASKAQGNLATSRVTVLASALMRVVLHIAGFALLTMAAFQWNIIAGLAVAGISCFVFSTLMTGTATDDERSGNGQVR